MSAPSLDLSSKTEQVLAAYLSAPATITATITTGKASSDKVAPLVVCEASTFGEQDPPYSGNQWIDAEVIVKSIAAVDADGVATKPADDTLVATVSDLVVVSDLPAQLNAAALAAAIEFTCMGVTFDGGDSGQDGDAWINSIKVKLYCCPSTLAA